jgi:hypothetical protein
MEAGNKIAPLDALKMNLKFGPIKVSSVGYGFGIAFCLFLLFIAILALSYLFWCGVAWVLMWLLNFFVVFAITKVKVLAGGAILMIVASLFSKK